MGEGIKRNELTRGTDIGAMGDILEVEGCSRPTEIDQEQQLLPGLPNEFTLVQIVPKLSWRDFHNLSSVSLTWQKAIQSRQVYDARVRFQATETLFVLNHGPSPHVQEITLYSMRDECFIKLPRFPFSHGEGIPESCQLISLDGKLYVLGGGKFFTCSTNVYVLDLAEQRQWRQCASMNEPRRNFGCAVKDGKIYVFGGICADLPRHNYLQESEVYDPELDDWFFIKSMKHMRCAQMVTVFREEMLVYGGHVDPEEDSEYDASYDDPDTPPDEVRCASFMEVYHPGKDEWKLVIPFMKMGQNAFFTARGKLYLMKPSGIMVRSSDSDEDPLLDLNSLSFDTVALNFPSFYCVHAVHAVTDELLALVHGASIPMAKGRSGSSEAKGLEARMKKERMKKARTKNGEMEKARMKRASMEKLCGKNCIAFSHFNLVLDVV